MYYMIIEDRMDVKCALEGKPTPQVKNKLGGNHSGLIHKSKDGINLGEPEIGYNINNYCLMWT